MKSKLKNNFVPSLISLLLVNGIIITATLDIFNYNFVKASSNWTLDTDSDFENGTLNNLSVTGIGSNAKLMIPLTSNWYKINSENTPGKRCVHASATIYGTDKILINGGYGQYNISSGTWIYDLSDNNWENINPEIHPVSKSMHSMASIYGTDKIMLFGGELNGQETWIFDLSENNWTEKKPKNSPPARSNFAMTSVYNTDKIILFGGENDEKFFSDTWEYDLSDNNWTNMYPKNKPSSCASHSMANIYGTDKIIKMGGYAESSRGQNREIYGTMIYDLSENNWTFYKTDIAPDVYTGSAMAEIYNTDKVLLFSGDTGVGLLNETWVFDLSESNWTRINYEFGPRDRAGHTVSCIYNTNKILMFGGFYMENYQEKDLGDSWIFHYSPNITSGKYISSMYDTKANSTFKYLDWNSFTTPNNSLKFQLRSGLFKSELQNKSFLGPDGSQQTYYLTPSIPWEGHNGDRWIQFIVYFNTKNKNETPILYNITIEYNCYPILTMATINPKNGNISTQFNFTIRYIDQNNDPPTLIYLRMDGQNYSMIDDDFNDTNFIDGKKYWYATKLKAGNHSYKFYCSDGEKDYSTDSRNVYVDKGHLNRISVDPSYAVITTDDFILFRAMGYDSDGNILAINPKWDANGGGLIDKLGNFSATTPGNWMIFANQSGVSGSAIINITRGKLAGISISPNKIKITTDDFVQFYAKGYDSDMNFWPIDPTWEVSGGGVIDQWGNYTAQVPGEWIIYANSSGKTGTAEIIVNLGKLISIKIDPQYPTILINGYQKFTASGFDEDNNIISITPEWEVSGGGLIDEFGNFTPKETGNWTIFANFSEISGNTIITVLDISKSNDTNDSVEDILDNDKDNDNIPDLWEKNYGLNISTPSDANLDFDNDYLTNYEEYLNGTNPLSPDTDGDRFSDKAEIENGTNPLDKDDYPEQEEPKPDKKKESQNNDYGFFIIIGIIIIMVLIIFGLMINHKMKKTENKKFKGSKHKNKDEQPQEQRLEDSKKGN